MNIIEDLKIQYKIGGIANKLIYWNVACFLISLIFFYEFNLGIFNFPNWLALSNYPAIFLLKPWTFLTYAFLHDGFWHLAFNMMVLSFSSQLFLTFFTEKQYLGLYFLTAIFSGFTFALGYFLLDLNASIVGASAAIMGILVAVTTYQPLMNVRLLLIGNVKLWHITAVILILDVLQVRLDNVGGHISHLGGGIFGFIFIQLLKNGVDLSKMVTAVTEFPSTIFKKKKTPFKKVIKNHTLPPIETKPVSRIVIKDKAQQQIDELLDKIGQSGYDSLTKDEKEFLFRVGK